MKWDANTSEGYTLHVCANEGQDVKHGLRRKHVFTHVSTNAYEEMEMKNGGEIMSFIVTFGKKEKSKYMEENDILFYFSKCDV